MTSPVTAEYFTDPFSPYCWAAEPVVRRLAFAYDAVDWLPRPTVLLPDAAEPGRLPYGVESLAELDELGRRLAERTGMPYVPELWSDDPPASSRPACEAVAAVRERSPGGANRYLRQLRERVFVEGEPPVTNASLTALAETVPGVDAAALERDLTDGTALAALAADLERARGTAELRGRVETRGDPDFLPYGPRRAAVESSSGRDRDGRDDRPSGADRAGADEQGNDGADGPSGPSGDDDTTGEAAADEAADGGPTDDEAAEPVVVAPPAIRFEADGATVIASLDAGYDLLKDAVNKLDPDIRNTAVSHAPHGTREMTRRGISPELAERMVGGEHAGRIRRYLSRFGRAFVPELVAGVDVTRTTCRLALLELESDGAVRKVPLGAGDAWELGDGARR